MKLVAYLVPDGFEKWKLPQGIEHSYVVERVPGNGLADVSAWLVLGQTLAMALWRILSVRSEK